MSAADSAMGFGYFPGYLNRHCQAALVAELRPLLRAAPLYQPHMPGNNRPFSVRMTNLGPLGWVSDQQGYRYQPHHPRTGRPWPDVPPRLLEIWRDVTGCGKPPQCCLVNWYGHAAAKMGLHQDRDEADLTAPVLSISLGDSARFRLGGLTRKGPTRPLKLHSGDVLVLRGADRLAYHGIDKLYFGSSTLLPNHGRLNLTLRRVTL